MYRRIRLTTVCAIVALAAAAWPGQAGALHSAGSPAVAASMAGQTVVSSQQVTESSVASARRHCRWIATLRAGATAPASESSTAYAHGSSLLGATST